MCSEMAMAMGWRRIILLEFMGILLVSLASFPRLVADSDTKEAECWYTLEVKTWKFPYSGTKDHVKVRIGDKNGTNVTDHYLSEPIEGDKEDPFRRGKTAKFNISGTCLQGEVCTLQFQVQGDDTWLVDEATVQTQNNELYPFQFLKPFPPKTWDGYICEEDEQRPSDQKNKNLRKKGETKQSSCTRRKLLRTKHKKFSSGSGKSGNNGPKIDNPCHV